MNKTKTYFFLLLIFLTSSCILIKEPMPKTWNWGLKPRPLTGVRNFPEANTIYGKGFKDGCESAWAKVTRGLTESVLKTRFNYDLHHQSKDYFLGWFDGFEQCTYIVDWDVV